MENYVPVYKISESNSKLTSIKNEFKKYFGKHPDYFVRVPGRVNLIGEHIDYCGYSVCPMALQQDILLAVSVEKNKKLKLHNSDPKYENFECDIDNFDVSFDNGTAPKWYRYFLCGTKGALDIANNIIENGLNVAVSGTIPPAAGLSSSSALVSAATLSVIKSLNITISKEELANACAICERYIGTQGGGMDQAIAFLASQNCAKLIHFNPLRSEDVALPKDACFVVAHSATNLNKAATSDYNRRVVECRIAAQIIAKNEGIDWRAFKKLGEVQKELKISLDGAVKLVEKYLVKDWYCKEDVVKMLDITYEELCEISLTTNTKDLDEFKLKQRALHVFKEAARVQQFVDACRNAPEESKLETLGNIMNKSHESLRDLYECSNTQLDELVKMSQNFAFGARLTGAGWGGCIVALVSKENVQKYILYLKEHYYKPRGITDNFDNIIFYTEPTQGACIYE